jgi:dTDP-4-amino-4,6-dideoxygalactose transaminase
VQIPFNDIKSGYLSIESEINEAIAQVLAGGQFVGGSFVKAFEEQFASYIGVKHCINTGNGTDSLFAMLKCIGVGPDDEVLTPAWSWISTSETISLTGATPVFVDADAATYNISGSESEKKITSKTKALLAVHLYGQSCDLEKLQFVCSKNNLVLLEDCAQSHGARHQDKMVGTLGSISSFSFYPTKNLGALGDAGCLLTNDDDLAVNLRRFVNHGGLKKDEHLFEGINSRMDALQAAILCVKLDHLEKWNKRRNTIAQHYQSKLGTLDWLTLPTAEENNKHTYHLFVVRCKKRNELKTFLETQGINTIIHYPTALPFEPSYSRFNYKLSDFPVAAQLQNEVLSLPCYPEMTDEMVEYICATIKKFSH